jgi:hypothetical protein
MKERSFEQGEGIGPHVLSRIHKGMKVHDSRGQEIGQVVHIYFGMVNAEAIERGYGTASPPDPRLKDEEFVDDVVEMIVGDQESAPQELRYRLVREGFIEIQSNAFDSPRYIPPECIAQVTSSGVFLGTSGDLLIEH